jgi:hypothetical protein
LLQRKCACGGAPGADGECAACRQKRLQRKSASQDEVTGVPSSVHDVLRSSGQPLDPATRAFMEPRFGHDFSQVRVHADTRAAAAANAVHALAYTAGQNLVFAQNQYSPQTASGQQLIAHELAHVVQQSHLLAGSPSGIGSPVSDEERQAEHAAVSALSGSETPIPALSRSPRPTVSRRVIPRLVNCTAGSDGAPADLVTELTAIEDRSRAMVGAVSILLTLAGTLTRAGMGAPGSIVETAFEDHFGVPPAVRGGFMNRLTGSVQPTLDEARGQEMELMARRYELIANAFDGPLHYRCISGASSFGGCNIPDCSNDAWACPGVDAIFLCPGFWAPGDPGTQSTLLIHETSHMIWEHVIHGAGGSGGNFRHAECYASFVGGIFGITPGLPACPVP